MRGVAGTAAAIGVAVMCSLLALMPEKKFDIERIIPAVGASFFAAFAVMHASGQWR